MNNSSKNESIQAPLSECGTTISSRIRVPALIADQCETTLVSVVVPCYNYGRYLAQCVESVLTQQGVDVEVIIVDDASSDDSVEVARSLAKDRRVTVIEQPTNRGPVQTFNHGLSATRGEFIVRLDADDMLTPGSLRRAVALALNFPSVGLVYGRPVHFTGTRPPARTSVHHWTVWPGSMWVEKRCRQGTNVITSPEVLMRASIVRRVGGQKDLAHSHDMEMWMRIAAFSDVGYIQGADQAWHRDHDLSLSAREVDLVSDLYDRKAAFDELFSGAAKQRLDVRSLRSKAMHALSQEALKLATHQFDRGRAQPETTQRLVEFALTATDCRSTRQWRALQRRVRVTPLLKKVPLFLPAAFGRRVRFEVKRRVWMKQGI